ncbi:hypothetical protein HHI36_001290 [Cryptolaemus montrouzieri]|uniref:Uncharacterized protein n=1 Tax=Cryptolaemus montrouzieri TaxID=559131 RepID=A0ABD2P7X5_9CUCU
MKSLLFCCLAAIILSTDATPSEEIKNIVDMKNIEHKKLADIENKVQDHPESSPQVVDRIDENLSPSINDDIGVKNDKGDLETANTFWGGYYRSPSWGWGRGWGGGYGGYGGYGWYPSYNRNYGSGGRGYNNGWGWGNGYRGWNGGYYWK